MSDWKAISVLQQAHQAGLEKMEWLQSAIEELKQGKTDSALGRLRDLTGFFDGDLRLHFFQEENALFPAISHAIGPMGPVAVMLDEHKALWQAIDRLEEEIERGVQGEASTAPLQHVASYILWALRSHIEKEDRMLFPLAEAHLNIAEREAVTSLIESSLVPAGIA
ncbi:MAG: hemerythrin domain-containing protein [Chloroflexi bacterium]|nr:hemerythrin domain-containing protein [Chloroflexota bacterium]